MTEMERTLSEALTYAKIGELPAKAEEGANDWIKAIALVRKQNNRTNYAIAANDGMGVPQIIADFGPAMIIREVVEIYPYMARGTGGIPSFKDKDDIVDYLVRNGEDRKKMQALISDKYINGKDKPESKREQDKAKIKILVEKYSIINAQVIKEREEASEIDEDAEAQIVGQEKTSEDDF